MRIRQPFVMVTQSHQIFSGEASKTCLNEIYTLDNSIYPVIFNAITLWKKEFTRVTHGGSDRLFQSMVESSTLKEGKDVNKMRL